jgi:DNA-binding response OmpR family regulator
MSDQPDAHASPILFVNHDAGFLSLMRLAFERAGFNVITALGGQEALDICHTQPVALVVLDIMMPGMDGFATLKALYADPAMRLIPVIIASPQAQPKVIAEAYDLGAKDYVVLPCRIQEFVARVRQAISGAGV